MSVIIYRKKLTHPAGDEGLQLQNTPPQEVAFIQKILLIQEGWILDPLPGPTSTSQVGSTGRLLAPVLPGPATCFTRCSITSSSCDIRVPLQYPVGKLCLLGKGVHGNYVQLCRKTTFSEFAFANIYTRSVCTTIQVEYDALTQHTQQTTVKSTNQTFEY